MFFGRRPSTTPQVERFTNDEIAPPGKTPFSASAPTLRRRTRSPCNPHSSLILLGGLLSELLEGLLGLLPLSRQQKPLCSDPLVFQHRVALVQLDDLADVGQTEDAQLLLASLDEVDVVNWEVLGSFSVSCVSSCFWLSDVMLPGCISPPWLSLVPLSDLASRPAWNSVANSICFHLACLPSRPVQTPPPCHRIRLKSMHMSRGSSLCLSLASSGGTNKPKNSRMPVTPGSGR